MRMVVISVCAIQDMKVMEKIEQIKTIVKSRVVNKNQQIVRIDDEIIQSEIKINQDLNAS